MYIVCRELNEKCIESFGSCENIEEAELLQKTIKAFLQYDVKILEI